MANPLLALAGGPNARGRGYKAPTDLPMPPPPRRGPPPGPPGAPPPDAGGPPPPGAGGPGGPGAAAAPGAAPGANMSPEQAVGVLSKLGITPDMLPLVIAAITTIEQAGGPQQGVKPPDEPAPDEAAPPKPEEVDQV